MKTVQQMPTAIDRMSTHEELHQVLALVSESVPCVSNEAPSESDEKKALQEALADLWRDTPPDKHNDEHDHDKDSDVDDEMCHWAEMLAGGTERIN